MGEMIWMLDMGAVSIGGLGLRNAQFWHLSCLQTNATGGCRLAIRHPGVFALRYGEIPLDVVRVSWRDHGVFLLHGAVRTQRVACPARRGSRGSGRLALRRRPRLDSARVLRVRNASCDLRATNRELIKAISQFAIRT